MILLYDYVLHVYPCVGSCRHVTSAGICSSIINQVIIGMTHCDSFVG